MSAKKQQMTQPPIVEKNCANTKFGGGLGIGGTETKGQFISVMKLSSRKTQLRLTDECKLHLQHKINSDSCL